MTQGIFVLFYAWVISFQSIDSSHRPLNILGEFRRKGVESLLIRYRISYIPVLTAISSKKSYASMRVKSSLRAGFHSNRMKWFHWRTCPKPDVRSWFAKSYLKFYIIPLELALYFLKTFWNHLRICIYSTIQHLPSSWAHKTLLNWKRVAKKILYICEYLAGIHVFRYISMDMSVHGTCMWCMRNYEPFFIQVCCVLYSRACG